MSAARQHVCIPNPIKLMPKVEAAVLTAWESPALATVLALSIQLARPLKVGLMRNAEKMVPSAVALGVTSGTGRLASVSEPQFIKIEREERIARVKNTHRN
jgi:hypothetical protein